MDTPFGHVNPERNVLRRHCQQFPRQAFAATRSVSKLDGIFEARSYANETPNRSVRPNIVCFIDCLFCGIIVASTSIAVPNVVNNDWLENCRRRRRCTSSLPDSRRKGIDRREVVVCSHQDRASSGTNACCHDKCFAGIGAWVSKRLLGVQTFTGDDGLDLLLENFMIEFGSIVFQRRGKYVFCESFITDDGVVNGLSCKWCL
jgi:hypothetical protein